MTTFAVVGLLAALVSVPARAQTLNLNFDAIAEKAKEITEMKLDGPMLEMLKQATLKGVGKEQQALFAAIEEISLQDFEFAKKGDYSDSDLAPLRKQLSATAGWSRVLNAKDKKDDTEIYMLMRGDKPSGFLLIVAEPKELTVIHVAGSIQLAQLHELINSAVYFKDLAQE
jgi:hypothetical protein